MSGQGPMIAMGPQHAHHHYAPVTEPLTHSGGHSNSLDHCAMCVVGACAYVLASTAPSVGSSPFVHEGMQLLVGATPRLRQDWSLASPRGPPIRV